MCIHKTLSHGSNGYIVYCQRCNHYQIGFGTSLINMCESEYREFCAVAEEQFHEHKNNGIERQKNIQLPAFAHNNLMILSFVELEMLMEMLKEVAIMTEVESILKKKMFKMKND